MSNEGIPINVLAGYLLRKYSGKHRLWVKTCSQSDRVKAWTLTHKPSKGPWVGVGVVDLDRDVTDYEVISEQVRLSISWAVS